MFIYFWRNKYIRHKLIFKAEHFYASSFMSGGDVTPSKTELFNAPKEQFGLQISVNVMNIKYKKE